LLDAALTHFGIRAGLVEEGNPLMKQVIEKSWSYFYIIKIFLPLLLLGLFYLRPFKGKLRTLLISTCVLYLSVLVFHMAWIALYLNTST
jgi:glucan phosphoethanolaminetransferase (alkaline phosphatase superfamily)